MLPILNANDAAQAETLDAGARIHSLARMLPIGYVLVCVLYGVVAYVSMGYDDEFTNMALVEQRGLGVVSLTQAEDVHPPGQYLINWLLHALTGDWSLVRLVTALLTALSLIYATEAVRQRYGDRAAGMLFVLLCLNPAILMWCTGVRWYAYFVPVLVWLSITPQRNDWRYWAKCFGGLALLGYIGYAVFVVALPVLLLYWTGARQGIREKTVGMFWGALAGALLYAYQFHIFLTVHLQAKGSQVSSMAKSLMGFAIAQVSNQGVFPVSVPALLSASGIAGMVWLAFRADARGNLRNRYLLAYGTGSVIAIVLGIAGKFRNLVIASPWQAMWLATLRVPAQRLNAFLICFAALAGGNIWGAFNVATHQNTTKNSWDLQLPPVMAALARSNAACGGDLVVLAHDPALNWHVDQAGYPQLGPFSRQTLSGDVLNATHRCVAVVRSYAGMFDTVAIDQMYGQVNGLQRGAESRQQFGRDSNYRIKQRLDARYPEYQFDITLYHDVSGLAGLTAWQPIAQRQP
ncbi:ArnT family glycosyltransferase [Ralstonia soli]|uniref:Glycosyltransferase family 39 protein n=1 Tax=Ralstonia soli TaxID=2953896 RepID=A0ABT1AGG1_9RALS|nr:glycosyltransferase family 39 protein [Ralstonia soli]MCO5397483.1 glycosyltransferase family 39 protein [Ralstonia soli]